MTKNDPLITLHWRQVACFGMVKLSRVVLVVGPASAVQGKLGGVHGEHLALFLHTIDDLKALLLLGQTKVLTYPDYHAVLVLPLALEIIITHVNDQAWEACLLLSSHNLFFHGFVGDVVEVLATKAQDGHSFEGSRAVQDVLIGVLYAFAEVNVLY